MRSASLTCQPTEQHCNCRWLRTPVPPFQGRKPGSLGPQQAGSSARWTGMYSYFILRSMYDMYLIPLLRKNNRLQSYVPWRTVRCEYVPPTKAQRRLLLYINRQRNEPGMLYVPWYMFCHHLITGPLKRTLLLAVHAGGKSKRNHILSSIQ